MATCTVCGNTVTGKKFCPQCGTAVKAAPITSPSYTRLCPQCQGEVRSDAAFCMHCGTALNVLPVPSVEMRSCPACHTQVDAATAFCTQCGHDMRAPAGLQCSQCGRQNAANMRFCGGCGTPLSNQAGLNVPTPAYQQQPSQYAQPYAQPQYGPANYQQPMVGQQQMVLRCPTCMAMAPLGSTSCTSCRTNLAGVVPMPANMPVQGQQGGMGGFLQGDGGKYAIGALGGAAAVLGGEMLMRGIENQIEDNIGFGGRHHHRHNEDEGLLGGLGKLADDIGLI
ncbi:hypothetical protein KDA_02600 [Dictyobacter alpinus]|uniref:DZANK-type domain-containing protein n=1 Tax=Dictyobacter alpinus TaxID=2014873 RepID=A0A402B0A0_9CHLR|nr:zinc ribbon domain-containing protein [Dictyobacter alpinus]GCE24776.1 hypothetical protein KDA_02600 [Dictyobacter alpinus]